MQKFGSKNSVNVKSEASGRLNGSPKGKDYTFPLHFKQCIYFYLLHFQNDRKWKGPAPKVWAPSIVARHVGQIVNSLSTLVTVSSSLLGFPFWVLLFACNCIIISYHVPLYIYFSWCLKKNCPGLSVCFSLQTEYLCWSKLSQSQYSLGTCDRHFHSFMGKEIDNGC